MGSQGRMLVANNVVDDQTKVVEQEDIGEVGKRRGETRSALCDKNDHAMCCQLRNSCQQKRTMTKIHKRHNYQFNEDHGKRQPVGSNSNGATPDGIQARELPSHVVNDHAIEDHAVKRTRVGAPGDETELQDYYPWFSARVVCHWIAQRIEKEVTLYWNIDDCDGRASYEEMGMEAPMEFIKDAETRAERYHQLRAELICFEDELEDEHHEVNNIERRERLRGLTKSIVETGKLHHYLAELEEQDNLAGSGSSKFQKMRHEKDRQTDMDNHVNDNHRGQLACFTKGSQVKKLVRRNKHDDEDSEDEHEGMVCQMTGEQWEQLPFPIIVDLGACTSVMPTSRCPHVPTEGTTESRAGEFFRAANGQKIYNEGTKIVSLMTKEGVMRDMKFTSCELSKALGSVSLICRAGHRVVFNPSWSEEGSYIEHLDTGEVMWLTSHNGIYVLDTRVAPHYKQTSKTRDTSFGRQAQP